VFCSAASAGRRYDAFGILLELCFHLFAAGKFSLPSFLSLVPPDDQLGILFAARPDDSGKVQSILSQEIFGVIRDCSSEARCVCFSAIDFESLFW
jgi:hypothetical protein